MRNCHKFQPQATPRRADDDDEQDTCGPDLQDDEQDACGPDFEDYEQEASNFPSGFDFDDEEQDELGLGGSMDQDR